MPAGKHDERARTAKNLRVRFSIESIARNLHAAIGTEREVMLLVRVKLIRVSESVRSPSITVAAQRPAQWCNMGIRCLHVPTSPIAGCEQGERSPTSPARYLQL
jgi:hypothetical protein